MIKSLIISANLVLINIATAESLMILFKMEYWTRFYFRLSLPESNVTDTVAFTVWLNERSWFSYLDVMRINHWENRFCNSRQCEALNTARLQQVQCVIYIWHWGEFTQTYVSCGFTLRQIKALKVLLLWCTQNVLVATGNIMSLFTRYEPSNILKN